MKHRLALALAALLVVAPAVLPVLAHAEDAAVVPLADVKWTPAGIPGVSVAPVEGDMAKGPCHFYLKYDAGFVAPLHHHSPDHYVTVVMGTLVLTVGGKDYRLAPGSFFQLLNKAPHAARVEGDQPSVMFVDARGPWDVVLEPESAPKK
jgi:mannose-6-phosphate isomerase-like protein (cupin superfamily)